MISLGWIENKENLEPIILDTELSKISLRSDSALKKTKADVLGIRFECESLSSNQLIVQDPYSAIFVLTFTTAPEFRLECLKEDDKIISTDFSFPTKTNNVWTFTKTETLLKIECNGLEFKVIPYSLFNKEVCRKKWSFKSKSFTFATRDTATDAYMISPRKGKSFFVLKISGT